MDDFKIENGVLQKYTGPGGDVVIPAGVTSIGRQAFFWCSGLTSITIPNSVTGIGDSAFQGCTRLTSVTIPKSVTGIGDQVFHGCKSLTNITIPDGVTGIGHEAFSGCESLKDITLPDSVTGIGDGAFSDCESLTSVTLPDSVTGIGEDAFNGCKRLAAIHVAEANPVYSSEDGVLFNKEKTILRRFPYGKSGAYVIPDGVTSIYWSAFANCKSLTSLTIPNSVTKIGSSAFSDCESLTSVVFARKYPDLGWGVFSGCIKLHLLPDELCTDLPLSTELAALCPPMTEKLLAHLALFQTAKAWREKVKEGVTADNADGVVRAVITLIEAQKELSDKIGTRAAEFALAHIQDVREGTLRALAAALEEKKCKKALKALRADLAAAAKLTAESAAPLHPIEALVQKNWVFNNTIKALQRVVKHGVHYANSKEICTPEAVEFVIAAYADQIPENRKGILVSEYRSGYFPFVRNETADQVAAGLNQKELLALIEDLTYRKDTVTNCIAALGRYADERRAAKMVSMMRQTGKQNTMLARGALMLNDTRTAMMHMEKVGRLEDYAKLRGTDAKTLRDTALEDFGLDESGKKIFDLGGRIVSAFVGQDFKVSLYDETEGKAVKSLPKRGADPEKYAAASADLSDLKKNVKKVVKARTDQLLGSFLDGKAYPSANWQKAYLTNPVLHRVSELLVWAQDKATFTLGKDGPIQSDGSAYVITDAPITVAHPMDMQAADVTAWQNYFVANGLKQPFEQVWEPVIDPKTIRPDRYKGQKVNVFRFKDKEKHGIEFFTEDGYMVFNLKDCELGYETYARIWALSAEDTFTLGMFSFKKYTRYTNHIVALLDRWTITRRILQDDVTVQNLLGGLTAAQIMEYIRLASENNCTNCTAMLLEYKQTHYPAFDPLAEFTLE